MSEWYEVEDDDLDLDIDQHQVNICIDPNNFGNVYVTMTWDQVEALYTKIQVAKANIDPGGD